MKHDWKFKITNKDHAKEHGVITVADMADTSDGVRHAQFYFGDPKLKGREIGDVVWSDMLPGREKEAESFLRIHGWI